MRAKVYGECSIGKSPDDTRCCEFVVLSYPRLARPYLESQVSICLSTDLPIYYWVHRFVDAAQSRRIPLPSLDARAACSLTAPARPQTGSATRGRFP